MAGAYLDKNGLSYFFGKLKSYFSIMPQSEADTGTAETLRTINAKVLSDKIITKEEYALLAKELATEYDPSSLYLAGDFVIKDLNIYERKTNMTNYEPWTASNWILLAHMVNGGFTVV